MDDRRRPTGPEAMFAADQAGARRMAIGLNEAVRFAGGFAMRPSQKILRVRLQTSTPSNEEASNIVRAVSTASSGERPGSSLLATILAFLTK